MKKCKFCAEEIKDDAIVCKHCHSDVCASANQKVTADKHSNYNTVSLVSILLPIVGIIIGIIYLTKQDKIDRKLGEHAIVFSLLGSILWYLVYAIIYSQNLF